MFSVKIEKNKCAYKKSRGLPKSRSMLQVVMGLLSRCEDSSLSLSPSSQMWRVSLVSPSSPMERTMPFTSIWPRRRRKTGRPSRSWWCHPPGK